MKKKTLLYRATILSILKICSYTPLRKAALRCFAVIWRDFFILQWKARWRKHKTLSYVDHQLDACIPFETRHVGIYMDFSPFWIRTQGFLLEHYGSAAIPAVAAFIEKIIALYENAGSIARKNFSTTKRPRYYGNFNFMMIHLFDPHLMCVPSLHVMVVLFTCTQFALQLRALGGEEKFAGEIAWAYQHALAITESILYVKQHSVNCIPLAVYTMNRIDSTLFNHKMIAHFSGELFKSPPFGIELVEKIKAHITTMYNSLCTQGEGAADWREPVFEFLREKQYLNIKTE